MSLEFSRPEIAAVALAVGIVASISGDGECNWLEGVQLLSVYLIIAILFFFLPEPPRIANETTGPTIPSEHRGPDPAPELPFSGLGDRIAHE